MKNLISVLAFLLAVPAGAYQAGQQNRTNFGTAKAQPAQGQYRSFSNYNNRSWGKGVQTRPVQTEVAGTSAVDFEKNAPQKTLGKTQATAPKQVRTVQPAAATTAVQASSAPAALPANVDPAAMMQQVQGMMNAMGTMTGGAPAQAGQNAPAMPAGMPDISALMGGAMPTAPAATPAKK